MAGIDSTIGCVMSIHNYYCCHSSRESLLGPLLMWPARQQSATVHLFMFSNSIHKSLYNVHSSAQVELSGG